MKVMLLGVEPYSLINFSGELIQALVKTKFEVKKIIWFIENPDKISKVGPESSENKSGVTKRCLRDVLDKYVPSNLIDRLKTGFAAPLGDCLRGLLKQWANSLLDQDLISRQGFLDSVAVKKLWSEHIS